MKVCFISEAESIHTQRWTSSLAQAGCDIHLISSSVEEIPDVSVHRMPIYSPMPWQQIINNLRIRKLIKELEPDVTHLFGLFALSSLGAMFLIRGLKNSVASVWGSDVVTVNNGETCKQRLIKKYLLNRVDRILANSEYLASETVKYLNSLREIDVVPWGVDIAKFLFVDREKEKRLIHVGFAKRLHLLSGPDILLKAFQYARDRCSRKIMLKIAGDGPMEAQLKQDAVQMGLADSIEWAGWLGDPEAVRKFYGSIDVFVMPSRRESLGVSAIEAAASGLPVVASRFGGIPEIVVHGETGLLIDPEDIEGFGKAIVSLVENENLRREMGIKGRKRVEERFDWRSSIKMMTDIYRQMSRK